MDSEARTVESGILRSIADRDTQRTVDLAPAIIIIMVGTDPERVTDEPPGNWILRSTPILISRGREGRQPGRIRRDSA